MTAATPPTTKRKLASLSSQSISAPDAGVTSPGYWDAGADRKGRHQQDEQEHEPLPGEPVVELIVPDTKAEAGQCGNANELRHGAAEEARPEPRVVANSGHGRRFDATPPAFRDVLT